MLLAEVVKKVLPANAELRLQTAGSIVDACMDDFAVARGGFCANGGVSLDEERRCVWPLGELARDSEANYTTTDNLIPEVSTYL